jgi:hypothetical protein
MPSRLIFRCEHCGVEPDPLTQVSLERQLLHQRFGEYVDAGPGAWLVWHGRGIYGRTLYACGEHRGDLKAFVRRHYGTLGWHPWSMRTYPSLPPDNAVIARRRMTRTGTPKFGIG